MSRMFDRSDEIFRDEDILREDYQPDSLKEREDELEEYKAALQPVVNNAQPRNIFLYGKTGVGKTVVTKYILERLKKDCQDYDDINLTVVWVNCMDLNTSYQLGVKLVNRFREINDEKPLSSTGYPEHRVFEILYDEMEKISGTILMVLDEVDNIGHEDKILYEFPRARAHGNLEGVKPGIIGISNNLKFRKSLSSKVTDTLCEEELNFDPYDADELRSILNRRAEKAFYDDTVEDDSIQLIAALAARDRGSARQGLDLLYKAGDIARQQDDDKVDIEKVEIAREEIEKDRVQEGIGDLTKQAYVSLLSVTQLELNGSSFSRTREVYREYENIAKYNEIDSLVRDRMQDHLSDLEMLGILNKKEVNKGKSGGRYYKYGLAVSPDVVVEVVGDNEFVDIPPSIRRRV